MHLFSPKHHVRANRILDDVLSFEPNNAVCLMGRGYVLQTAQKWADAAELFLKVTEQLPDDVDLGLVAREQHAWCLAEGGELDVAVEELQSVLDRLEDLDGYEERKARVWWRLGQCYWRLGGMRNPVVCHADIDDYFIQTNPEKNRTAILLPLSNAPQALHLLSPLWVCTTLRRQHRPTLPVLLNVSKRRSSWTRGRQTRRGGLRTALRRRGNGISSRSLHVGLLMAKVVLEAA